MNLPCPLTANSKYLCDLSKGLPLISETKDLSILNECFTWTSHITIIQERAEFVKCKDYNSTNLMSIPTRRRNLTN